MRDSNVYTTDFKIGLLQALPRLSYLASMEPKQPEPGTDALHLGAVSNTAPQLWVSVQPTVSPPRDEA